MLTKITLTLNPLLDCMINEKCCSVDHGRGICPLSSSLRQGMAAQVSIHSKGMLMQCPEVHRVGEGMLRGVGSPKIDWYIIVALLLIQALVEDQVHHPNDLGAQAIAITDNEDQEPIHSPIQITAVLNLVPVCSTPEGKRQNPCLFVCFLRGFHLSKNYCFFFCYLKSVPYACHMLFLLAVTTAFIISMLLSELLPTVLL